MNALESSADKLVLQAEQTGKLTLIAKSNSLLQYNYPRQALKILLRSLYLIIKVWLPYM